MHEYQFFGELGYLINCILPNVDKIGNNTMIYCFENYKFILSQYCNANFKTISFKSSIERSSDKNLKNISNCDDRVQNLRSFAAPTCLTNIKNFKNLSKPIVSKPIPVLNKSILCNFRNRSKRTYGNFDRKFYETIVTYFKDFNIYCCGNVSETFILNIPNIKINQISFEDIPYVASQVDACILPDSGLTSMIIKCNPKKVIVLLNKTDHTIKYNHEEIYRKNIENFKPLHRIIFIENNFIDDNQLNEIKQFIEFNLDSNLSLIL